MHPMSSTDNAPLQVAVLAEIDPRETRVAMTPDDVRRLTKRVAVTVERGAGILDAHSRKAGTELARVEPVRGRATAVENSGFGQHERPRADRGDSPRSSHRSPQESEDARSRWLDDDSA